MNWRLKIATYRLAWDETIRDGRAMIPPAARGLAEPRPVFERTVERFAGWTVWKFRIASFLIIIRYYRRKGA